MQASSQASPCLQRGDQPYAHLRRLERSGAGLILMAASWSPGAGPPALRWTRPRPGPRSPPAAGTGNKASPAVGGRHTVERSVRVLLPLASVALTAHFPTRRALSVECLRCRVASPRACDEP
jgi:hypothetical protein